MGIISKLFTTGAADALGGLADKVAGIVDRFKLTDDEKAQIHLEVERLAMQTSTEIELTHRAEMQAKERIMVAELQQGDVWTKRARPTVIFFGLAVIGWNYSLVPVLWPLLQHFMDGLPALGTMELPEWFWIAWGGIVGTYSIGRTLEKRGASNNLVRAITGNEAPPSLADQVGAKFSSILG